MANATITPKPTHMNGTKLGSIGASHHTLIPKMIDRPKTIHTKVATMAILNPSGMVTPFCELTVSLRLLTGEGVSDIVMSPGLSKLESTQSVVEDLKARRTGPAVP